MCFWQVWNLFVSCEPRKTMFSNNEPSHILHKTYKFDQNTQYFHLFHFFGPLFEFCEWYLCWNTRKILYFGPFLGHSGKSWDPKNCKFIWVILASAIDFPRGGNECTGGVENFHISLKIVSALTDCRRLPYWEQSKYLTVFWERSISQHDGFCK